MTSSVATSLKIDNEDTEMMGRFCLLGMNIDRIWQSKNTPQTST